MGWPCKPEEGSEGELHRQVHGSNEKGSGKSITTCREHPLVIHGQNGCKSKPMLRPPSNRLQNPAD